MSEVHHKLAELADRHDALLVEKRELLAQVAELREALIGVSKQGPCWCATFNHEEHEPGCVAAFRSLAQPAPAALDALKREVAERVREALKARVHGTNTNHSATYCALKEPMRGIAYAVAHELERYWVEQIDALDLTALLAEAR